MTKLYKKIYTAPFVSLTYSCNFFCKDCYVRGLEKNFSNHMTLENFAKLIDWLKKQKLKDVVVTGGEPTSHPNFIKILQIFQKEGFLLDVVSNCLFDEDVINEINNKYVKSFVVDYLYSSVEGEKLQKYEKNINNIFQKNIPIHFFCRIPLKFSEQKFFLEKIKKYNATVSLRFVMPGMSGDAVSIRKRKKDIKDSIPFLVLLKKERINFSLYDPLPQCFLDDNSWNFLKKEKIKVRRICSSLKYSTSWKERSSYLDRLTITPSLSIFPCYSLFFEGPSILSFEKIEDINVVFKKFYEKWRWEVPLMEKCKKCEHFIKKQCQGGCLNYKYHKHHKEKIMNIKH